MDDHMQWYFKGDAYAADSSVPFTSVEPLVVQNESSLMAQYCKDLDFVCIMFADYLVFTNREWQTCSVKHCANRRSWRFALAGHHNILILHLIVYLWDHSIFLKKWLHVVYPLPWWFWIILTSLFQWSIHKNVNFSLLNLHVYTLFINCTSKDHYFCKKCVPISRISAFCSRKLLIREKKWAFNLKTRAIISLILFFFSIIFV